MEILKNLINFIPNLLYKSLTAIIFMVNAIANDTIIMVKSITKYTTWIKKDIFELLYKLCKYYNMPKLQVK